MPSMPFSLCSVTFMPCGNVIGHQRGNADAEIDIKAVVQFPRGARGHLFAGPGHQTVSSSACADGALLDTLFVVWRLEDALHENARRVDRVGIESRPAATSSSTSATVTLPAVAIIGLKLRAVLR